MPTKTEAADLLMALYGRHGESPLPVVAASTPADCFNSAIEAARIAVEHRTPVILLTDTFLANSSEPWKLPDVDSLPQIDPRFATEPNDGDRFMPYLRDDKLARPWAVPGTPGLRHRIGGLEKEDVTGNISYQPENHDFMTRLRAERIARVEVPDVEVDDPDGDATLLVLGWARATARSRAPPGACGASRASSSPPPTCGTSTRCRATSSRCCGRTSGYSCRR